MSSPRLNSVAKKAQRQLVKARQQAFDETLGQIIHCDGCGKEFTLTASTYRGVAVRNRVHIEAVRYACPHCDAVTAVLIDGLDAS